MLFNGKNIMIIYPIIAFLLIFNPPIVKNFSFSVFFTIVGLGYVLTNFPSVKIILNDRVISKYITANILLLVYYFLIVLVNCLDSNVSSIIINDYLQYVFQNVALFVVTFSFVILCKKNDIKIYDILKFLVGAGIIEATLVLLAFLFPPVKNVFTEMMLNVIDSDVRWRFTYESSYRNYGLASSLYDIFGYTMSILSILALYIARKGVKRYYLFALLIVFAGVINARTTIVLFAFGALCLIYGDKIKTSGSLVRIMLASVIIGLGVILFFIIGGDFIGDNEWLNSGIDEMILFLKGEKVGYFSALFDKFLFFPQNLIEVFMGCGDTPMALLKRNTDVGYVQSIWRFGIIGSVIVYYSNYRLMRNVKVKKNISDAFINANIVMFFLYQIKLNSLGYSQAGIVLIIMLMSFLIFDAKDDTADL